jgi:hypothetical protein
MSLRTYEAGTLVGKGPSVSVGAKVQLPELLDELVVVVLLFAEDELDEVLGVASLLLLQASNNTGVLVAPIIKLRKKLFLSIIFPFTSVRLNNIKV